MITFTLAQGMTMPVDENLSQFSDLAYRTGFGLYVLALLASLLYYAGFQVARTARREERVAVGAGGPEMVLTDAHSLTDDSDEDVTAGNGDRWARFTLLFTGLGLAFHIGSLVLRGLATSRVPWGNMYEYASLTCALGIIAALATLRRPALRAAWPFVLVPVLALMFVGATVLYADAAPVVPALRSYWLPIHVSVVSLGCGVLFISGMISVMYLLRVWQPKGAEHGPMAVVARPMPSADTLDRLAYRTAIIGFPIFGIGILLGAVWAETAWGRFWGWDPKETTSFVAWVLYAGYLHARATTGWGARKAAWINIAGFVVFVFNLFFINMVVSGLHSYAGLN